MNKIDERQYRSIIADMMKSWEGGDKYEYLAMEWISKEIYKEFIVSRK